MNVRQSKTPLVGLALGSGSARGWAHIGVIRELAALGIRPDLVCGTSIGALVAAIYASGHLDELEQWVCELDRREIFRYLDIRLLTGGGFVEGRRLMDFFRSRMGDIAIGELATPFAAVATDLASGQEIWLREGVMLEAVRASIALPGFFTPVLVNGQWLVDGGLVNPVPVSLCRAMGAECVIAVNLNGDMVGKYFRRRAATQPDEEPSPEATLLARLSGELKRCTHSLRREPEAVNPGLFDVMVGAINIMQDRITHSRMAGDPPDVIVAPCLSQIGLLEFDRAAEAIEEGRASVRRALPALERLAARQSGI